MRGSSGALLLSVRRRGRTAALCLAVIGLIFFTAFRGEASGRSSSSTKSGDQRLSKYLEYVTPWAKPKPTRTPNAHTRLPETEVEHLPIVPPTLQENDDFDDLDEEFLGLDEEAGGSASGLPNHYWRSDGLVDVNHQGVHPIYELIERAEAKWNVKKRRASKTLKQAVREYRRRYKRLPPKGFDHWWDYVQKYDIQLPDEYDQIFRDLEPYWGIDPQYLQAAQRDWEAHRDSFTIGKVTDDSPLTILNTSLPDDRRREFLTFAAKPQMELLNEVHQYIPAFRATISPHDSPSLVADWQWRNAAVEAASKKVYLDKPEHMEPLERLGWSGACPRDSPLYRNPPALFQDPIPQESKTFIHDHRATMDPCYHPQHILDHGSYLFLDVDPIPSRFTAPQFSFSATTLHIDIHATSMAQTSALLEDDLAWEDKDDDRLFWRGSPTGMWHREGLNWRYSQRIRLVNLTAGPIIENPDAELLSGKSTDPTYTTVQYLRPDRLNDEPVGGLTRADRRKVNDGLMDVAFAGLVNGCEGIACEIMGRDLAWRVYEDSGPLGAGRYKYLMDVDGNGWSSRFRRLMSSNSLVFKSTIFPEWWTDRIQPWVHYVPIQVDYSDLYDVLVFFSGDLSGEGAHEDMARKIGAAGRDWVLRHWRPEDVTAYMFRLWLEYARVMSEDREELTYHLPQGVL